MTAKDSAISEASPGSLARALMVVALLGVTFGIANLWTWHGEINAVREVREVDEVVANLEATLQREADSLALLAGFHAEVGAVTETQYRGVAEKVLLDRAGVQALEWVRRYSQEEADAAGILVREAAGADPVPARGRPDYYPVWYVYPEAGNAAAERYDMGSNPARRAAIEEAERTGRAVATAPVQLVQDVDKSAAFLWFQPVERSADGEVPGFALGVYRVGDLLDAGIGERLGGGTAVEVRDAGTGEVIYAVGDLSGASLHRREVPVGGRTWQVMIGLHPQARLFTIFGIFGMWLGGVGLVILSWKLWDEQEGRQRVVEQRVEERTRELREMADSLAVARDEAQRADHAKTQFLAMMSHELRTPVHGQLGMMRLLRHDRLTAEQKGLLGASIRSGETLLSLLNDLLDVAKLNANAMGLEAVVFAMDEVLADVRGLSEGFMADSDVALEVRSDEAIPPLLRGDVAKLKQVLVNLMSNAGKFTRSGHVRLTVDLEEEHAERVTLRITCEDTGIGIPAAAMPKLFDPFTQADSSTSRRFGGTGLGLNIVHRMTELMGGTIEVESEEGRGTTFTLHLPFERAVERTATPEVTMRELSPLRACRVLVVDDNSVNRLVACKMLDVLGHVAEEAVDGRDALQKLAETTFELVLMDVHMPNLNGVDATSELRASQGPNRDVPVLALTADAVETNKELCVEVGMDGFLSKPFSTEELDTALRAALQRTL